MATGGRHSGSKNVCLTMHQPWASLLVQGIKRVEGRSWSSEHRGRLWIHAAAKVPTDAEVTTLDLCALSQHGMEHKRTDAVSQMYKKLGLSDRVGNRVESDWTDVHIPYVNVLVPK